MPIYESSTVAVPSGRNESTSLKLDLGGLDLTTPVDLIKDGRTPYARNFRLYAQQSDDRRVGVSSRKGPSKLTVPLTETLAIDNSSTTGASIVPVGIVQNVQMQPFIATNNDRLSCIDLKLSDPDGATGPIVVSIYSDLAGFPGSLLTQSGILGGGIAEYPGWHEARFVNPIQLVSGDKYWIVIELQDDGTKEYFLSTNGVGSNAYSSNGGIAAATEEDYSIQYRLYTSPDLRPKGAYRWNRQGGINLTVVAYGNSIYYIDPATNDFELIEDNLNSSATEYSFTDADGKIFWVNSYDDLRAWDGEPITNTNIVVNPSFGTNTTGWSAVDSATLARDTSVFQSTPASLKITRASGNRGTKYDYTFKAHRKYKVKFWARAETGTTTLTSTGKSGTTTLTTTWQEISYDMILDADSATFSTSAPANYYIDTVEIIDSGVEVIKNPVLPILSQITIHKEYLFGVNASSKNQIVWSRKPFTPAENPESAQWYYSWRSVDFWQVPAPKTGSPIVKILSFQDGLIIFTQDRKHVLSGDDPGNFYLRESTGNKGAISHRAVVNDENFIYFVSDDGYYVFDGSSDKKLSDLVSPIYDACGYKYNITPVMWKNQVRFYMASQGSVVNDIALIWDKNVEEMYLDTNVHVDRAVYCNDADDNHELIEFSSGVGIAYVGEQEYNSLGGPIDFQYRMTYDSMKLPGQKKKIRRMYPLFQGVDTTFRVTVEMDKDFQDSPREKFILLTVSGLKVGAFNIGDGSTIGGATSFKRHRQSWSGYAYYWQPRLSRNGINNRVAFAGVHFSYKTKRL